MSYRYSVEYTEDDPEVLLFPQDPEQFFITDEDNSFVLRATLTIVNTDSLLPGVRDQLNASSTSRFRVSQSNNNTVLVVEAIGGRMLVTTHEEMAAFLMTISFITDDQAPDVVRNISVLVQEFPLGEAKPAPSFFPVSVLPLNDQPILRSSRVSEAPLEDYLRENPGFNASFLLSEEDVRDVDRYSRIDQDFVGLAVIGQEVSGGLGVWQYRASGDAYWSDFPAYISLCSPLRVNPYTRIRFSPAPSLSKEDGEASIRYQAWDGSSDNDTLCSIPQSGGMYIKQ